MAAYCRVSTDKDDQLLSLKAQKEFFEEYAERNNYELVGLYTDEGISGTKLKNRKAFNKMMQDAENGMFKTVFVKDISRFARNAVDFLNSIRKLKNMGIDCRFVTANLSTEDVELTLGILALVAQEESANLSKRVKFGKKKNAENGKVPNFVYGYNKIKGDYFNLEINEFESSVVKRIFDMYVNQGHGANKIVQILNKEFIKTKRNCKWSQNGISRILTNRIYIGEIINGKEVVENYLTGIRTKTVESNWHVIPRPELAIIPKSQFDRAQDILQSRLSAFKLNKERPSTKHSLSKLIKCENCGRSFGRMYREWVNSTYIKWCCGTRTANGVDCCTNRTLIDEKEILEAIRSYLLDIVSSRDKLLEQITAEFKKKYQPNKYEVSEQTLIAEIANLKKTKAKQIEMYEADVITISELKDRTNALSSSISRFENQLETLQGSTSMYDRLEATVNKYCGSINDALNMENFYNATLRHIIDKITVKENGEITIYLKLFSDLDINENS